MRSYTSDWPVARSAELLGRRGPRAAGRGRYIRPIAVVRVERRVRPDGERVHAEDARGSTCPRRAIRVKSADKDGEDLLRSCRRSDGITKAALMEGGRPSLTYAAQHATAITQLVGRACANPTLAAPNGRRWISATSTAGTPALASRSGEAGGTGGLRGEPRGGDEAVGRSRTSSSPRGRLAQPRLPAPHLAADHWESIGPQARPPSGGVRKETAPTWERSASEASTRP